MMKSRMTAALAVGGISLALVGCSSSPSGGDSSDGAKDGGQLIVSSFGGDYDKFLTEFTNPVFKKEMPGTDVVFASAANAANKTKLMAEKGGLGSFDVAQITAQDTFGLADAGVFEKLDPSKISNWDNIRPELVNDYCIPHIQSPIGIIYNADDVKNPPTTWKEFLQPDFAKRAGVSNNGWQMYVFFAAAAAEANGDPGKDWTDGYDLAVEAGQQMKGYASSETVGQALLSGEIDALAGPRARAAQWDAQGGPTIKMNVPQEGSFAYVSYTCIPANAPNKDAAYAYLNAELDPSSQLGFAEKMYYAPTVTNAELTPEMQEAIGVSEDEQSRIYSMPWGDLTEALVDQNKLWDSKVLGQ